MKALYRYLATPLVLIGGLLSFGWLLVAILAPLIAPYDPLQTIQPLMRPLNSGPNGEFFLLGTDMLGRDIFSRLIWGAQTVVIYSTLATLTAKVGSETLTLPETLNRLSDPDGARRKQAAQGLATALEARTSTLALCLNTLAYEKQVDDRWRKYPTPAASRHLANEVDADAV